MVEKFNYPQNKDDVVGWAFISVLSKLSETKAKKISHDGKGNYEINLTIDGTECSFLHIITRLTAEFEFQVKKEAQRLVSERIDKEFDAAANILEEAKRKLAVLFGLPEVEEY